MAQPNKRPIGDLDLAREFFRYFGSTEALKILGYLMVYGVAGRDTANELIAELKVAPPERTTQWRVFRRLRDFRDYLLALPEGWYVDMSEDEDVVPLARQIVDAIQSLIPKGGPRKQTPA